MCVYISRCPRQESSRHVIYCYSMLLLCSIEVKARHMFSQYVVLNFESGSDETSRTADRERQVPLVPLHTSSYIEKLPCLA